jgi:antitoxin VapB
VRLPAEFRFDGDDVDVRRDPVSGDVILSKPRASWDDYFAWVATHDLPADFMADRDQPRDDFRDPFATAPVPTTTKRR